MATFHGIPGFEPPDAPAWVDHVLRGCVVAGFLGYFAFIFRWVDSATWWGAWLPTLPGVLGPLALLPWWWGPERRPADALRLIIAGLLPAGVPALAVLSLPIALAVLLVAVLVVLRRGSPPKGCGPWERRLGGSASGPTPDIFGSPPR